MDLSIIEFKGEQESLITNDFNITKNSVFNRNFNPSKGPIAGKSQLSTQQPGETVIMKYKHKGINSLYYIQPKSQNIFILDFKRQSFIKERIEAQMLMP